MAERKANAEWKGSLNEGTGKVSLGSGLFEGAYSFGTRLGDDPGTNPEEWLGASLAGCFAMALNAALERGGHPADSVNAEAKVFLGKDDTGLKINRIDLTADVAISGIEEEKFQSIAADAKKNCPISRALAATDITLEARMV